MSEGREATPPRAASLSRLAPGWEMALVLVIVLGALAVFADKAFTIDDPLFVWLAKHLSVDPLDFYGFDVNWGAVVEPMHRATKNPPLAGYCLAGAARLFGWSEVALHLAFLVPAGVAVATCYGLARALCSHPLEASLIATLSPVFLISSTNVMSDTLMLALWCGALLCWMRGIDGERGFPLLAGAVLASLAALSKYFAVSLVPLFLVYGLLRRRALGSWTLFLLIPLAVLLGFEWLTKSLYSTGLVWEAVRFAADPTQPRAGGLGGRVFVGLVFAGGCVISLLFYAPLLWSRRAVLVGLAWLGLCLVFAPYSHEWLGVGLPAAADGSGWLAAQLFLFALGGVSLLGLVVSDVRRCGDADSWLLALWVLGTFAFAAIFNWTDSARAHLPMAPAVGILLMRQLDRRVLSGPGLPARGRLAVLVPAVLVALSVTWADYRWANEVRAVAVRMEQEVIALGRPTHFFGHWGFQYYLEEAGARPLDFLRDRAQPGDYLLVPRNNYLTPEEIDPSAASLVGEYTHSGPSWVQTVSPSRAAGFYDSEIGPMPYSFGRADPDLYRVFRVEKKMSFRTEE
jgi:4-amino-4-deoxy-L-arabinose transferase-like glycosyltransferase